MRRLIITAFVITSVLLSASCGATPAAVSTAPASAGPARQASFAHRSASLQALWRTDIVDGVPAGTIAALRQELARSAFATAGPSSSIWAASDGHALLDSLESRTAAAWTVSITTARQAAEAEIAAWSAVAGQYGSDIASSDAASASRWASDLLQALTPAAITALTARWAAALASARITAAATAALNAALAPYGGIGGLEAAARGVVASAQANHLDAGSVPLSLAGLEARAATGSGVAESVVTLIGAVEALRAVVGAFLGEGAQLAALQQRIARAGAMATAHAAGFPGEYAAIVAAYHAASSAAAVSAVGGRIYQLSAAVNADLNAAASAAQAVQLTSAGCGHTVPMGKVIVVSLGQQSAAFYANGCLLNTTAVTTGRPGMRTPMGTFHIYSRASPAHFVSMYRPGSPGYYTPETTRFAMAYEGGGFYLHDAPWEPDSAFGAGSQNGTYASHGCIHIPEGVMAWLFSWASMGTRVIVTG